MFMYIAPTMPPSLAILIWDDYLLDETSWQEIEWETRFDEDEL